MAQDGVADVVEVRGHGLVEKERVLDLTGVADDAVVADEDVLADVGVVADLAIPANDGRAFNHGAILNERAFANEHLFADIGHALAAVAQGRTQMGQQVSGDFWERLPGIVASLENGRVFCLDKIEQIGRLEHGATLKRQNPSAKLQKARRLPSAGERVESELVAQVQKRNLG